MKSRNPILRRSAAFNGRAAEVYGHQQYPASGAGYEGYAAGQPTAPVDTSRTSLAQPMTLDSVVSKTALTLFVLIAAAAMTWVFLPDGTSVGEANYVQPVWNGAALAGVGLGLLISFRRATVPPALVLLYAVVEGIFLGAFSEWFDQNVYSGVVMEAVLGTTAAFLATLVVYKVFGVRLGEGARRALFIAGAGFFVVVLGDFLLSLFGTDLGFNGLGPLGLVMSFVGLGIGILYLLADFDMIERAIATGVPDQESWRAAYAITAALVLIYIELVRILGIFQRS